VRVATYNVRNLFTAAHPTLAKRPRELRELARMVSKVDADVLALQEVENAAALGELNLRIRHPYAYFGLSEGNSNRGIHLAFLSRHPLVLTGHDDITLEDGSGAVLHEFASECADIMTPARIRRGVARARVTIGGQTLTVFSVHLKSRIQLEWSGVDSDAVRHAEAQAVARIVAGHEAEHPRDATVLLGDMNERHDHASLQPIMALGYFDPVLAELVPGDPTLSTHWIKSRDRIDHLLLSKTAHAHYVPGSALVHREAGARKASDHYPVSVDLEI